MLPETVTAKIIEKSTPRGTFSLLLDATIPALAPKRGARGTSVYRNILNSFIDSECATAEVSILGKTGPQVYSGLSSYRYEKIFKGVKLISRTVGEHPTCVKKVYLQRV